MYAVHEKSLNQDGSYRLRMLRPTSLAGCNSGIICEELRDIIKPTDTSPIGWSIAMSSIYAKASHSVIIDLKPNNDSETVVYELDTVFGFSFENWSPVMFRMKQLLNEDKKTGFDFKDFSYRDEDTEIVYTMMYLVGGIKDGQLIGKWVFPNRSSTNSVLFWPGAMTYFFQQVQKYDPYFLTSKVNFIR